METKPISQKNIDFFESVFQVVRLIPQGRVTSYGSIANYLGVKSGARMVGWAMNASHDQKEFVPAHRVVNRAGVLTGKHHFRPPESMQQALEQEGLKIEDDKILNFEERFWDPGIELNFQ